MNTSYLNIIGLAYRARKCSIGEENIINDIRNKKAKLVLISNDISESTKKKLTDKCSSFHIPYVEVEDRYTLGKALGKPERVAVAILDDGFAAKLKTLLL
ncbi:YlxQ family RNA-binding protein [Pseudogracilibacillus sp. SE30717A]|uniref:YlxQ family RNA-binding protein n=1 Tax=Pseudogracilibacillus sp. SE30717A TaxID=3098293 RepID=UPI00300E2D38